MKKSEQTRSSRKTPAKRHAAVEPGRRDTRDSPADRPTSSGGGFPVVGVGASAGGLDAFKRLLSAMPIDTGMAFVLVPHLDPTHKSLMVELLARQTTMAVCEARDGMVVEANHVYVIPPNADLTIEHRALRVSPPPARHASHTAIDAFLRSLADDQQAGAIGIILSGTGSHGSLGVKAIRAAGGLVVAQAPDSAEHDQMPRNAIATGVVDLVLPPEEMPKALLRHAADPAAAADAGTPEELKQILLLLLTQTKRDFRGYRSNMLMRRVRRRMGMRHVERVPEYVEYLRAHADEGQALAKDLSIGVTAFFREPEAFEVLERVVIPDLMQRIQHGDGERPVRVWVPGCASGEEAYSIAMLLLEQFGAVKRPVAAHVFATDVDEEALVTARAGLYPDTIAADLSAERLQRFFVPADGHRYQVSRALRETITFAPQNLISDAPFSRLDLIACRNVLIYLEPGAQAKVVALFHFALNEGGYLILGPAESIGQATDRFEPVSKKWRVFRRTGGTQRDLVDIPILPTTARRIPSPRHDERPRPPAAVTDLLHRTLLTEFAPAAVLVDRRYQIRSVQGPVVEYLEFPPGELTRDLLSMARPGLRPAIRGVCERARKSQHVAADADARVKRQGAYVPCTVTARPVAGAGDTESLLAVTFQDTTLTARGKATATRAAAYRRHDDASLVRHLEQELKTTRDDLQGTIAELETTNEELKASHEEVLSMNEELQSTNEELESSKEELQSLNEELSTVNSQLQDKVHELDASNSDMANLLAGTDIATVFLDSELRIKRFTPATARLFNLLPGDLKRPFSDIAPRVQDGALFDDARRVLETLTAVETVVGDEVGHWYLRRMLPYRTVDKRIEGVVITWVDITQRLAGEADGRQLITVLRDSNDAVVLLDLDGRIIGWNRGAERLYGYTEAEARARHLQDLAPESYRAGTIDLIRRVGHGDVNSESGEAQRITKHGRTRDVWQTMTVLRNSTGQAEALVTTERDVTELKDGLAASQAARVYRQMIEQLPAGAVLREGDRLTMNRAAETITGYERSALPTVEAWCAALHGQQAHDRRSLYERAGERVAPPVSLTITRKDGEARHLELTVSRLDDTRDLWMLLDLTDRDQAERALRRSEDHLRSIVTTAASAIITIDEHGTIDTFNPAAERLFGYTVAEVVGENVRLLMPQPYRDEHDGYLARYLRTGEARIIGTGREVVGRRKNGTTFPLDLAVSEIGRSRCFTGILRDLSDRRDLEGRLADSQLDERRHMARELHDDLGGHLTGIGLIAQTLQGELAKAGSPLAARTETLVGSIRDAQQHLRSVVRGLMPVEAIPEGLMVALDALAKQCTAGAGIACRFECERPVHIEDAGTAVHLFRIAQEAMHNAVRHAEATQIGMSLKRTAQRLEIAVSDNGRGLDSGPDRHSGIGLASMHQRARLLGGDCSVEPRDGGGTVVRCWVPTREGDGRNPRPPLPATTGGGATGSAKTTPTTTK